MPKRISWVKAQKMQLPWDRMEFNHPVKEEEADRMVRELASEIFCSRYALDLSNYGESAVLYYSMDNNLQGEEPDALT